MSALPYGASDPEDDGRYRRWLEASGYRYSRAGRCLHWIAHGACRDVFCDEGHSSHQWLDHVSGYTKDGKPALLLSQPYHLYDLRDLADTAERLGLDVEVSGRGWYGHGTVAIAFTRKGAGEV